MTVWARRASGALLLTPIMLVLLAAVLFPYVAPFVLAILLALLVDPTVERISRRLCWPRGRVVLLIVGLSSLLGPLAILLAAGQLSRELSHLLQHASQLADRMHGWSQQFLLFLEGSLAQLPHPLDDVIRRALASAAEAALAEAHRVLTVMGLLPDLLFSFFIGGLTAYFLLRDKDIFLRAWLTPLPREMQRAARQVARRLSQGALGFLRAQVILVAFTAASSVLAFHLLEVPYPWLLGTLAGLLDLVPLIGSGAVFVPVIALSLMGGHTAAALHSLVAWGMILVARQGLELRLMGSHMDLHPVTAIAAAYVGAKAVGLAGLILGPLAAVFLKAAFSALVPPRCQL